MVPHPVQIQPVALDAWAASGTGVPWVQERGGTTPGPEVLITALVHGNEFAGAIALDEFLRNGIHPRRGRITAAFCNVAAYQRFDPADPDASRFIGEDFNRLWSTSILEAPPSSPERQRAQAIRPFADRATHLLDLHSMHEPCAPLLITGPLPRNVALAQRLGSGAQVVMDRGHADGVRMRDFGAFGDPAGGKLALLLEAGQHWEHSSVQTSRNVLMRFLVSVGSLDRIDVPHGWLLPDAVSPPPLAVTHRVVARSLAFEFAQDYRGGETIRRAGTVVATDGAKAVTTPYDDCVLVMPSVRQLRPGVTTVRFGRVMAEPLREQPAPHALTCP
ncbi:MAG: succinylglutamate desuccinylase/aspartoacylase family protein [Hydrogenophaga sp.]|nr:succinylglutamate desuccinylase/aspartoacylase family protein [Hydrogenophaga sp.]